MRHIDTILNELAEENLYVQVLKKWFAGNPVVTQWITSTKPLLNTRKAFLPTVKSKKKNTKLKRSSRRELAWPREPPQADQPTIIFAAGHHD